MKEVLTPLEMRAVDKNTEYNHIPTLVLMENAGSRIADYIINNFSDKKRVSIYSGSGGNGGDGFVIARHLLNHGWKVHLFLLARPDNIKNRDSKLNYESIKLINKTDNNLSLNVITDSSQLKPDNSDVIVDAILGTGVNGRLREPVSSAVDIINYSPATVLSVDVPSGMNPLSGEVPDKCVVARTTLTLHKAKTGLLKSQKSYVGEIHVCDIGIPRISEEYVGRGDIIKLAASRHDSHKGENGSVLIVGSNRDYTGAVIFAAEAALKAGVDLVYIVAPSISAGIIKQHNLEFIVRSVPGDTLSMNAYDDIMQLAGRVDSVLLGPGSGVSEATGELFNNLVEKLDKTVVLDADALKLVGVDKLGSNVIVTPHEHEFMQLFGEEVPSNLDEKILLVNRLSARYGVTVLLKGVTDVVSCGDDYKLNSTGNSGMTIGGTGDLLAGLTVAYSSMNSNFVSAYVASFVLGRVCDELADDMGSYRICDILEKLSSWKKIV